MKQAMMTPVQATLAIAMLSMDFQNYFWGAE